MRTQATARYIRVPASKARLVLDHIRGKSVGEALAVLQFTPKAAARLIEKVLRSAIANAEHEHTVRRVATSTPSEFATALSLAASP